MFVAKKYIRLFLVLCIIAVASVSLAHHRMRCPSDINLTLIDSSLTTGKGMRVLACYYTHSIHTTGGITLPPPATG